MGPRYVNIMVLLKIYCFCLVWLLFCFKRLDRYGQLQLSDKLTCPVEPWRLVYLYYYRRRVCVFAKFDQFLPVRSHFDTKRPVNLFHVATFQSATFGRPLFAFVLCVLRQKSLKEPKMLGKRIDRRRRRPNRWCKIGPISARTVSIRLQSAHKFCSHSNFPIR